MEKRWCSSCGRAFEPRPQSPRQAYCPEPDCQQARKRLWQRTKRKTDYGYYENQVKSQARWRRQNSDYWRQYREDHPDYAATNREKQKERNTRHRQESALIAKSDTSHENLPASGLYRLVAMESHQRGNHQEWVVQLTVIQKSGDR